MCVLRINSCVMLVRRRRSDLRDTLSGALPLHAAWRGAVYLTVRQAHRRAQAFGIAMLVLAAVNTIKTTKVRRTCVLGSQRPCPPTRARRNTRQHAAHSVGLRCGMGGAQLTDHGALQARGHGQTVGWQGRRRHLQVRAAVAPPPRAREQFSGWSDARSGGLSF